MNIIYDFLDVFNSFANEIIIYGLQENDYTEILIKYLKSFYDGNIETGLQGQNKLGMSVSERTACCNNSRMTGPVQSTYLMLHKAADSIQRQKLKNL